MQCLFSRRPPCVDLSAELLALAREQESGCVVVAGPLDHSPLPRSRVSRSTTSSPSLSQRESTAADYKDLYVHD